MAWKRKWPQKLLLDQVLGARPHAAPLLDPRPKRECALLPHLRRAMVKAPFAEEVSVERITISRAEARWLERILWQALREARR